MAQSGLKREYSKSELLKVIDECQNFQAAAERVVKSMIPDGAYDPNVDEMAERFIKTADKVRAKLTRIKSDFKKKKFFVHPEKLDEQGVSASQYSLTSSQSPPSSLDMFTDDLMDDLPVEHFSQNSQSVQVSPRWQLTVRSKVRTKGLVRDVLAGEATMTNSP